MNPGGDQHNPFGVVRRLGKSAVLGQDRQTPKEFDFREQTSLPKGVPGMGQHGSRRFRASTPEGSRAVALPIDTASGVAEKVQPPSGVDFLALSRATLLRLRESANKNKLDYLTSVD